MFRARVKSAFFATVLCAFGAGVCPGVPRQTPGVISGFVSVVGTRAPIAGAQVTVIKVAADGTSNTTPSIPSVNTDNAGAFGIRNLDPGSYRLTILADGYARQESARTIDVAAGQTVSGIAVNLTPAGTLTGRVVDARGHPLPGVVVWLYRRTYSATGEPSLRIVREASGARTNDLGEYRFYWLTPGRYYVSAQDTATSGTLSGGPADVFDVAVSRGSNEVHENYAETFFPGVSEQEKASAIDIRPDIETRDINLTLTRSKGYRVRGRVIDSSTGQPPAQIQMTGIGGSRSNNDVNGTFEFSNVLPGTYVLRASADTNSLQFLIGQTPVETPRGAERIVVRDADVEGVLIALSRPPVIQGRARTENDLPLQVTGPRVTLVPGDRDESLISGALPSATIRPDGTVDLAGFARGTFRIRMSSLPAGLYLKEASLDGVDVLNNLVPFARPGRLALVVSDRGGQLEGVVRDEQGRPVAGAQAVLIPQNRERSELYKRAITNPTGRFTLSGIPPGEYKIFGWEGLEEYAYFDPLVMARSENQGRPVRISESSRQSLELAVIPAGETP
jgi:hypothetical protein